MVFEAISFLIAFPLCLIMARFINIWDNDVDERRMYLLFSKYWDGKRNSEIQAWKTVRLFLIEKEASKREIAWIEDYVQNLEKQSQLHVLGGKEISHFVIKD